jgi:hypothetical protein
MNERGDSKTSTGLLPNIWRVTPKRARRLMTNPIVVGLLTFAVGGTIGNRSDAAYLDRLVPWLAGTETYPNVVVATGVIALVFSVWLLLAAIRISDERNQYLDASSQLNDANRHLQLETQTIKTELARLEERLQNQHTPVTLQTSDSFYAQLSHLVTTSAVAQDLLVSIGEADFVHGWLLRLYEDAHAGRGSYPRIRRVVVKGLNPALRANLLRLGILSPGFETRMEANLRALEERMVTERVPVVRGSWAGIPSFHGFIYGPWLFTNSWSVDQEGFLHVRTPLQRTTAEETPDLFDRLMRDFDAP